MMVFQKVLFSALVGWLFCMGVQPTETSAADSHVLKMEIRGTINPATADFLKTTLHRAETEKAAAVLIELDTPGGLVASTRIMAQLIDESKVPVLVFVGPAGASATSAGALLMLASHVAGMAPGTNIGAAHPVSLSGGSEGQDAKGVMGEKIVNDVKAFARSLAELRGRNTQLAEEIVAKSTSFTAPEALERKLIEILVPTSQEFLVRAHGRNVSLKSGPTTLVLDHAKQESVAMSWGQKLLDTLSNPNIAAILMTLAMVLIYLELSNPGISVAGILGVICLVVAFMAFQTLPITTGGVALLVLGMIMMAAEIFASTHGVLAAGGLLSFVLGLLWLIDPNEPSFAIHRWVIVGAGAGLGTAVAILAWAASRTRKLARETRARVGGGGTSGLIGYQGHVEHVEGKAANEGKALFRGELWDFQSNEPVAVGDAVEAMQVHGFKVHVKKKEKSDV